MTTNSPQLIEKSTPSSALKNFFQFHKVSLLSQI